MGIPSNYTYLLLDIGSVAIPLILSFDKKVQFYKQWWRLFPAMLIGGLSFLLWDEWFTRMQVWQFNPVYITGIYWGHLPLEEWLFFFLIPYACIFVYECFRAYFNPFFESISINLSKIVAIVLSIIFISIAIIFNDRIYTLITFLGAGVMLILNLLLFKGKKFMLFIGMWIIHLIPFYIINGVLTSLPVVIYNNSENMNFRIGSVPFEDAFYSMFLLLINITIYELLGKWRSNRQKTILN